MHHPSVGPQAWVRAPDMVPGDVIAGDVKVKLIGPCPDAESYALALRYKEKIFWKIRREDAPIPKRPNVKYNYTEPNRDLFAVPLPFQNTGNPDYNETEWTAYQNSVQNKDLWSVHEEERIAFEIKTRLVGAEGANPLSTSFTTRFGILVPNTNYPPGLDCRLSVMRSGGDGDKISSESIYEYFIEIRFSNGTTSEIPAGMTAFTPFYLSTENEAPSVNVSLTHAGLGSNTELLEPSVDLRSNYTIEVSFPDGAHVYQNSSVNITATVHRMGYTNRTDTPMELCVSPSRSSIIGWHPQELKNRSQPFRSSVKSLVHSVVPSMVPSMRPPRLEVSHRGSHSSCRDINFAAAPADLIHEGHISSTFSEPLSLSLHMDHDAVPDFSTYYQKLGNRFNLDLHVKPDALDWEHEFEMKRREKQTEDMDETDFDWVPWLSPKQTYRQILTGNASFSVIPIQNQRLAQSVPIHYLSDEARQPTFVKLSDIADLRSMSPEERDLLAPFAQPSIKVFAEGEQLPHRYFTLTGPQRPIYVGDTWAKKVLPMTAEGQRERDSTDRLLVVQ
ncbi:hypothetical protein DFH29DRAFT_844028 [Suillus ampliporus]|nr:hypothetical protein DFH29DRAFT_844028 [Suillus ampliporus]